MMIRLTRVHENAVKPSYATPGSACFDLSSCKMVKIKAGETVVVPTGLVFEIPEGYEVVIRPRSGIALKTGLRVANSPGTIDSDYRGEVGIIIHNTSNQVKVINEGDRIAQGKLQRAEQTQFVFTDYLTDTERGENGFGSTGN